ncbi:hypothetical protein [uncultured Jatrophihabitans sp.]|uniref:hypothetical protein n=1 Tax=uncultured Jatrophihabitans sp. TaxID=1610747 RepID=UPI0035CBB76B
MVARRAGHDVTAWLAVVLVCLSAALAALLEALLVPLYAGSVLVPIAVVAALASNVGLPLLARAAVPSMIGVALPYVAWLIAIIGFGVFGRPEGDIILPGGNPQWVAYGVLLGGALAGMVTVVSIAPRLGATG